MTSLVSYMFKCRNTSTNFLLYQSNFATLTRHFSNLLPHHYTILTDNYHISTSLKLGFEYNTKLNT